MINYLIDSENVGVRWIPYLKENIKKTDRVFLFYTDASKSIPCKELETLAGFIHQIKTIYCENGTPNALDFQLCSYLGYLVRVGTKSTYCILTQDKGYDAVVHFWKEKGIHIYRYGNLAEPPKDIALSSLSVTVKKKQKKSEKDFPHLGSILSLKANNPTLKQVTDIVKKSNSSSEVSAGLNSLLGKKVGIKYYQALEKHLKKYYNEK